MPEQYDGATIIVAAHDGEKIVTTNIRQEYDTDDLSSIARHFVTTSDLVSRNTAFSSLDDLVTSLGDIAEMMRLRTIGVTSTMYEVIDVTPDNSKAMLADLVPEMANEWVHAIVSKLGMVSAEEGGAYFPHVEKLTKPLTQHTPLFLSSLSPEAFKYIVYSTLI